MKSYLFLWVFSAITLSGCSQGNLKNQKNASQKVGAPCEGCEAIYEQAPDFNKLNWIDTLPDFNEQGQKLIISGIIYKADGKTPAPNVVLYVYHTDQTGHYTPKDGQTGWSKRNGYIRG